MTRCTPRALQIHLHCWNFSLDVANSESGELSRYLIRLTMLINRCSELRSSLLSRRKCNAAHDTTGLSIAKQIELLNLNLTLRSEFRGSSRAASAHYCRIISYWRWLAAAKIFDEYYPSSTLSLYNTLIIAGWHCPLISLLSCARCRSISYWRWLAAAAAC